MSAGSATLAGRAAAEALMVDACIITAEGATPTWNESTGTYDAPVGTTVYTGKCEIKSPPALTSHMVEAGELPWLLSAVIVKLPIAGSEAVGAGNTVTVTSATLDANLVGKSYAVIEAPAGSFLTARRLHCKEVTG